MQKEIKPNPVCQLIKCSNPSKYTPILHLVTGLHSPLDGTIEVVMSIGVCESCKTYFIEKVIEDLMLKAAENLLVHHTIVDLESSTWEMKEIDNEHKSSKENSG